MSAGNRRQPDGTGLIELDPWLAPYAQGLERRCEAYRMHRDRIRASGGLGGAFTRWHEFVGLHPGTDGNRPGVRYREWAPGADYLSLIGDFNNWDRGANPLVREPDGMWSCFVPDDWPGGAPKHGGRVKVHVYAGGQALDRIPSTIRCVAQEADASFTGIHWSPPAPYRFRHRRPTFVGGLRIYEAHVGMALEEGRIGTFAEFAAGVLPRIAALGYNAVQLMAVMQHPYYASFGYHVANFYSVASWFGNPDDLKALVDAAHGLGLQVIMDLVHSHSVKNVSEGLNRFDGTDHQYFHAGARGEHPAWDSLCFDYGKPEVQRFLLSNVRYWLEEFRFDGFRFDGVTSMLYHDHGLGRPFDSYDDYFGGNVDLDAAAYLMLANDVAHATRRGAITVAEDVSGMPGMARPTCEGGLGFDYRLAMGLPDMWIRLLKERRDEEWDLGGIFHTLLNRRAHEKHVGYAESHDQALVGDKTLAFRMMDQAMYWSMSTETEDPVVSRGIALHKMIRLVTFALGGEAWLNFMGNEFGHPEWVDFPRDGNGHSFQYARRQWSLADSPGLRYAGLRQFDQALMELDARYGILEDPFIELLMIDEERRLLVFRRGPLVFATNWSPDHSYADLDMPVPDRSDYISLIDTNRLLFGGYGSIVPDALYPVRGAAIAGREQGVRIYLPARSAQVLKPVWLQGRK